MKKYLLIALAFLSFASPVFAADVDVETGTSFGDQLHVRVWDTDDATWRYFFVCDAGPNPHCDILNDGLGTATYNGNSFEGIFTAIDGRLADVEVLAAGKYTTPTPTAHIVDAATNASGGAVTNLPTNFNLVSGLLGIANGLNDANSAQNDLATKYNSLVTKYNDLSTKFNTLNAHLETLGLQSP